jgi:hypothetical protein
LTNLAESLPSVCIRESSSAYSAACGQHEVIVCGQQHSQRDGLETFVKAAFAMKHGAPVCSFMPAMLATRSEAGRLCGVAEFRSMRQLLAGYGPPLTELAPAEAGRVSGLGDEWGR